jgi:disulfide bond formation protein DsbB
MIIVTVVSLLAWRSLRRFTKKYALAIILIVTVITSFIVINNVRTLGAFRENITQDYDIVYYISPALFPFVVQKHHNWSSQEYFYQFLFLSHEGSVVYKETPKPDQSEFMHWSLFGISTTLCLLGFFLAAWLIITAEFVRWYQLQERD